MIRLFTLEKCDLLLPKRPRRRKDKGIQEYRQTKCTDYAFISDVFYSENGGLTPSSMSCPGTCTFIPQRPVTKFMGLEKRSATWKNGMRGTMDTYIRTVPNAVNLL